MTDIPTELEKILRGLKYQVLRGQVSDTGWQTEVWFDVTDTARQAILNLITEARLDELDNLPWKHTEKYGINTPYVTKKWLIERKAELNRKPRLVGVTMPDGQVVRLHGQGEATLKKGTSDDTNS